MKRSASRVCLLWIFIANGSFYQVNAFSVPSNHNPSSFESVAVLGVGDLRLNDRPSSHDAVAILLTDDNIRNMPNAKTHTIDTVQLIHQAYLDIAKQQTSNEKFFYCEDIQFLPNAKKYKVCDLGHVDNTLGYGAYSAFQQQQAEQTHNVKLWNDFLRDEPWRNIQQFQGANYADYERQFIRRINAKPPLDPHTIITTDETFETTNAAVAIIPTFNQLLDRFIRVLNLNSETVQAEVNTGLFATHWGGLDHSSVVETAILQNILDHGDDRIMSAKSNPKSLEHSSIQWQQKTAWMIQGESTVRYLAAPLLLGTVSARRILQTSNIPVTNFIEAREWHKILAAATVQQELPVNTATFKYWRWHGFLCRYVENSSNNENNNANSDMPSLVLVHGFGASATQWLDVMRESSVHSYAPDQLGFGHAEKPGISYTAYLWDSMLKDFCREIIPNEYVAAGNSIGGFTSLSLAASDSATVKQWSSNGAPGTNQCAGLVLCNSAGNIVSKSEANDLVATQQPSIARRTAMGGLSPCKPPARFVAKVFGNVILSQLRPRIQSICKGLYPTNPDAVDDELCAEIARDSLDPGAIHVMMSGSKLPPPRTANELLNADFGNGNADEESTFDGPVLIAQGVLDPLNDAKDRLQRYGALRKGITMHPIQAGHCPHDEVPHEVAGAINKWLQTAVVRQSRTTTMASKR